MTVSLSLSGKVALITGGSRGIGAAAVRMFVAAGARVVFNYQKSKSEADKLAQECGKDRCIAIAADLSGTENASELISAAVNRFGRLDILVANHGIWPPEDTPIDKMADEQWHKTIAVNLDSVFALIKHSVAQMKRQGKPDSPALAGDGIYVNCVAPGWVDTDMSAPALNDAVSSQAILSVIPLGRVGKPEEIAGPILFLCTEHASFITGEVFNVNGGAVLAG